MTAADKIAEAHRSDEEMLLKVGCPWCGQTENLRFRSVGSLTSDMPARPYKVLCMNGDCEDVSGPVAYGKLGAARAWNKRADLADAQAQEIAKLQEAGKERDRIIAEKVREVAELRAHLNRMLMAQDGVPLNAIEFGRWVDEARAALGETP